MNDKLTKMINESFYAMIAVAAVDQKTKTQDGMKELVALFLAMDWINGEVASEVLAYAQSQFVAAI